MSSNSLCHGGRERSLVNKAHSPVRCFHSRLNRRWSQETGITVTETAVILHYTRRTTNVEQDNCADALMHH